jgi:hypothetical protein
LNNVHRITKPFSKALLERFATYDLCPLKELAVPRERIPRVPGPGFKVQEGFRCNVCPSSLLAWPAYFTIHKQHMNDHLGQHKLGLMPKKVWAAGKGSRCLRQTLSSALGLIRYF